MSCRYQGRMRSTTLQTAVAWMLVTGALTAQTTTSTITASLPSLSFAYQVNAASLPTALTVTINATGAALTSTLAVQVVSTPSGWLTVTPDTGRAPLALSVSVNPTGLAPGSYAGLITVNTRACRQQSGQRQRDFIGAKPATHTWSPLQRLPTIRLRLRPSPSALPRARAQRIRTVP